MTLPMSRVLTDFPYPVAYPYRLVFDPALAASQRRWALCFTEYQLLRTVCLPLVSQYLRDEIDRTAKDSIGALNRATGPRRWPAAKLGSTGCAAPIWWSPPRRICPTNWPPRWRNPPACC